MCCMREEYVLHAWRSDNNPGPAITGFVFLVDILPSCDWFSGTEGLESRRLGGMYGIRGREGAICIRFIP